MLTAFIVEAGIEEENKYWRRNYKMSLMKKYEGFTLCNDFQMSDNNGLMPKRLAEQSF